MMPLDDELRAVLTSRADAVPPLADPLAGIEARASRLRRGRVARSVVGAAVAVALVGVGVPLALGEDPTPRSSTLAGPSSAPSTAPSSTPPPVEASPSPSATPSAPSTPSATELAGLDPEDPWPYRGTRLPDAFLAVARTSWSALHGGTEVVALYGQVYEPSGRAEVVVLGRGPGAARWAVLQDSDRGPQVVWDEELRPGATALVAALPGDEQARLLMVAAPTSLALLYSPDRVVQEEFAVLAPGVGTHPLDGDESRDRVLVRAPGGLVHDRQAPSLAPTPPATPTPPADEQPAAVVDWAARGDAAAGPALDEALVALPAALGEPDAQVRARVLFAGSSDSGLRYLVGQAWVVGSDVAHPFSWTTGGTSGPQVFVGRAATARPSVLAFVLCCAPGTSTDTLVVVPQPGTGQVLYGDDDATGVRPVGEGQDGLDGVVLVDRDPRASTDQLRLLDGDGRQTWTGPVVPLLCGLRECG